MNIKFRMVLGVFSFHYTEKSAHEVNRVGADPLKYALKK